MQIFTPNLEMVITEICNMNCSHCLQGCGPKETMSEEIIKTTLQQFRYIGNLAVCGGEPTLATEQMEMLFDHIIKNNLCVDSVSVVINGTIYSEEFLRLLDAMSTYVHQRHNPLFMPEVRFAISDDKYHKRYMIEHDLLGAYYENLEKYMQSQHFKGLGMVKRPIRQGNANDLPWYETRKFKPHKPIIYYPKENEDLICIGPNVGIAPDGRCCNINSSIEDRDEYTYGNILEQPISEIYTTHPKTRILSRRHTVAPFLKECDRTLKSSD